VNIDMGNVKSVWLDTNVIIYYFKFNSEFSPKAKYLIDEAGKGKFELKISPMVISECVFVLMGRSFRVKKDEIKKILTSFIQLPGVKMEEKNVIEEALDNFSKKGIDFTDAYIAAHAKSVLPAHVITENIKDFKGLDVLAEVIPEPQDEGNL
jgi:predicted nucleic-acid-binding protein